MFAASGLAVGLLIGLLVLTVFLRASLSIAGKLGLERVGDRRGDATNRERSDEADVPLADSLLEDPPSELGPLGQDTFGRCFVTAAIATMFNFFARVGVLLIVGSAPVGAAYAGLIVAAGLAVINLAVLTVLIKFRHQTSAGTAMGIVAILFALIGILIGALYFVFYRG